MVGTCTTTSGVTCEENKRESAGESILIEHEGQIGNGDDLLPGILNEITVQQIFPKLEWIQFQSLSAINSGWREAIQSRRVYDARVRLQSTETLVALLHRGSNNANDISLYSVRDDALYRLPRIPGLRNGIPLDSQCVSLDGKLYVLGGLDQSHGLQASAVVYTLDLTMQKRWKQCASMSIPRRAFGCGVIHGKIYVFGGTSKCELILESEMFDPQEDVWYPIAPMISSRIHQNVAQVGDELFIYGGRFSDFEFPVASDRYRWKEALFAEAYHPLKDEWRRAENFTNPYKSRNTELVLTDCGKLHKMTHDGIDTYDNHMNTWIPVPSFKVAYADRSYGIAVGNVILAEADFWIPNEPIEGDVTSGRRLVRWLIKSERLVTKSDFNELKQEGYDGPDWKKSDKACQELEWQKVACTLVFRSSSPFSCLIQL